ncbi:diguanylate cyclase (GGDEF)-like protein [Amorphus suaedae]
MAHTSKPKTSRRPSIVAILLGNLFLFLAPTILIVAAFIYEIQRSETAQTQQYLQTEARAMSNGISAEITDAQLFMRLARRALTPLVERGDVAGCQAVAAELENGEGTLTGFFVTDSSGAIVCAADAALRGTSVASSDAFQTLSLGGQLYLGGARLDAQRRPRIPVSLGWRGADDAFAGTVGAQIDLGVVLAKARSGYALPESVVILSSNDGLVLAQIPDPGGQVGSRIQGTVDAPFVDGVDRVWSNQQIAVAGDLLRLSVGVPRTILEARTARVAWWVFAGLAAVVVLALLIGLAIASYFVRRPARSLVRTAEKLGSGDRSARAGDIGGARELVTLGAAFDQMAANLDAREQETERYRVAIEEARDDLEVRVRERTRDLNVMTERAEARAETVERRFEQETRLREIVTLIQASEDVEESASILRARMHDLFPGTCGSLALFAEPRSELETVAQWGDRSAFQESFTPDKCWGLRLGNPHRSGRDGFGNPRCRHIEDPALDVVCAPILVQGEARGVISVDLSEMPYEMVGKDASRAISTIETAAASIGIALYNVRLRGALRKLTIRDALTGLHNRRFADDVVAKEVSRARRTHQPVTLVRIDIDRFKMINDEFGFEAGDTVIREMAGLIDHFFRYEDVCSRYGGQDFLVVMVAATKVDAMRRCDILRSRIGDHNYFYRGVALPRISVSMGVATFPEDGATEEAVLAAVEAALSTAKHEGRDRVSGAPGVPSQSPEQPVLPGPADAGKAAKPADASKSEG